MVTPVLELIRAALNVNNILIDGEDPSADDAKATLFQLNSMLDSWNADNLIRFTERNDIFTLVPGQATYTVGPTGNFVMPRPTQIESAQVRISDSVEYSMEVVSNEVYNSITIKSITNSVQRVIMYRPEYPNGVVSFYPTPSAANPVRITTKAPFTNLSTMTEIVDLPPGYQEAIIYNLALRVATGRNRPLSQAATDMARDSLATIKRNNTEDTPLDCGDPLGNRAGAWNPRSGYWARA